MIYNDKDSCLIMSFWTLSLLVMMVFMLILAHFRILFYACDQKSLKTMHVHNLLFTSMCRRCLIWSISRKMTERSYFGVTKDMYHLTRGEKSSTWGQLAQQKGLEL